MSSAAPQGPPPGAFTAAAARAAYSALMRLLCPLLLLRLWWRGRREPGYRHHLGERFGFFRGAAPAPGALWVHAVSLGETRAAEPLLRALREARPGLRVLLTHGTATGRAAGAALLQPGDAQAWLPWDTPGAVRRFLRRHRPALGVLMETELWPNLVAGARRAQVPLVLANARLSERSLRRGRRFAALLQPALQGLQAVLAQGEADARRFAAAGAARVEVLGNLKFDMTPSAALLEQGRRWRAALERPVVLAASTRDGEEAALCSAWCAQPAPRPLLLLVPRHPQRFDAVAALLHEAGLVVARRSGWGGNPPPAEAAAADVWLGDSLGEMPLYYGMAELALLGGSFGPYGGQNLIEAAACGCPLLMGPHTFNFADAAAAAEAAGAARRVPDLPAAVQAARDWLRDEALRRATADRALTFAAGNRGATQRHVAQLLALMRR